MHGKIAGFGILVLSMALAIGSGLSNAQETDAQDLPEPQADAVWDYIQDADYRQNWSYWPDREAFYEGTHPHGALLTTYLNPIASDALRGEQTGPLPTGSIIVKENYMPKKDLAAITIMYKASEGYDPKHTNENVS